jgi:hypothetical protein
MESSWCKSSPVKAVAGRPEASVAVRRATGGREAYTARKRAARIELRNRPVVAKADAVVVAEGSTWITVTRGGQGSPESGARGTLSKGFPVNLGELAISPEMGSVLPNPKEPGLRGMRAAREKRTGPQREQPVAKGNRRRQLRVSEQAYDPIVPLKVENRRAPGRGGHDIHWREGGNRWTYRFGTVYTGRRTRKRISNGT